MTGRVDGAWRALLPISIRTSVQSSARRIEAWVDTGFTGNLVLPHSLISKLGLSDAGNMEVELGDGELVTMPMYECFIDWFGETKQVSAAASKSEIPLLGTNLLREQSVTIDYLARTVTIE